MNELVAFVQQHWIAFLVGLLGVIGSVASITSWIQAVRAQRKYDSLFKFVDLNVDKTVTEQQISQKKQQVTTIDAQIQTLKQQIVVDIPREARKAVLLDRLQSMTEDLTRNHSEIIEIKKKLLSLGHGSALGEDILKAVRHEIQPKYLIRERLSQQRTILAALTAASAVSSTLLPYPFGRILGIAFLVGAIPAIITILRYTILQRSVGHRSRVKRVAPSRPGKVNLVATLGSLAADEAAERVDAVIAESIHELIDSDEVTSEMATTNATDWGVDEYDIKSWTIAGDTVRVELTFHCTGEQDSDKMFSGDEITGTATATIDAGGHVEYEDVSAEKADYSE